MDDNKTKTTSSMFFATPLGHLELHPLNIPKAGNNRGELEYQTPPVTGTIVGMVSAREVWRDTYNAACHPYTKWWALVAQSRDEVIAGYVAKVNELTLAASTKDRELYCAQQEVVDWKKSRGDLLDQLNEQASHYADLKQKCRDANEANRKLEVDLAKVKRHIGEKAYADALAAAESKKP